MSPFEVIKKFKMSKLAESYLKGKTMYIHDRCNILGEPIYQETNLSVWIYNNFKFYLLLRKTKSKSKSIWD